MSGEAVNEALIKPGLKFKFKCCHSTILLTTNKKFKQSGSNTMQREVQSQLLGDDTSLPALGGFAGCRHATTNHILTKYSGLHAQLINPTVKL